MRGRTRWLLTLTIILLALVSSAGVLRAFVTVGPSDASTLLWGDLVLANAIAYDLRVPFSFRSLGSWRGVIGFKRVIAGPGNVVEIGIDAGDWIDASGESRDVVVRLAPEAGSAPRICGSSRWSSAAPTARRPRCHSANALLVARCARICWSVRS